MCDTNWLDLQASTFNWDFPGGEKNEKVLQRILEMVTNPGDLVLDSFLGSGTTAAVALKMGRRFIGVEMGEQGGISEAVGRKGGGGFRFYTLGNEVFDHEGHIKPDITCDQLAAHIYFTETKTPLNQGKKASGKSTFIGVYNGTAYALLYNGILKDKSIDGGNVLTHKTLNIILHDIEATGKTTDDLECLVIYGESTRLPSAHLRGMDIEFKQTPYDIKVW
jgi:adenine-specific DNA-methyltransferase